MFYYEVAPSDRLYHGEKYLTYQHDKVLKPGQIVVVTLQTKNITGFVTRKVPKPEFKTKPVSRVYGFFVPGSQVKLFIWMREYYPYGLGAIGSLFVPGSLLIRSQDSIKSLPASSVQSQTLPNLSTQQGFIAKAISVSKTRTHIVHGDTGSGKTRLYIELTAQALKNKKSAVILTPEISLTPQLIKRFQEAFSHVHVVHSHLTTAQRRSVWTTIASSPSPQVVIGPRSALFMPLSDIGIVIVDEFHEDAYKQEQAPRYHALRVAAKMAGIHDAKLVLGSATPPVEDYFYASSKGAEVHRLTELPTGAKVERTTQVVDLTKQEEMTSYPLISNTLKLAMTTALDAGDQVMIFHNKRGSSRAVLCKTCGWFARCSRCNIPYTYHGDSHRFMCHTCGKTEPTPNNCPDCRASDIIFRGPGTKTIAENLAKMFPSAKIGRYDKDNKVTETFSANQEAIERGDIDILVGTQLLSKGHDLPKLAVVGVLLAETGLQFPDYTAEQRSYQLLHQISGRVGRGHRPGVVILQTFNPELKTLIAAEHKKDAWESFYREQLAERKTFGFPPFTYILKIEVAKKNEKNTQTTAQKLADTIEKEQAGISVIGLAPAFIPQQAELWRWHIIVSSASRSRLFAVAKSLPKSVSYDLEPTNLL